jgi:hypothetical protein
MLSVVLYVAIGAFFLIRGLSGERSDSGPLAVIAFVAVVCAPLAVAGWLTWAWYSARKGRP